MKEQVYDYQSQTTAINEKGMFTFRLGLYNTDGEKVPDQHILQDLETQNQKKLEAIRNQILNNQGKK